MEQDYKKPNPLPWNIGFVRVENLRFFTQRSEFIYVLIFWYIKNLTQICQNLPTHQKSQNGVLSDNVNLSVSPNWNRW